MDIEDVVSAHLLAMEKAPAIGFARYIISGPAVVLGQTWLPNRVGFSSGVTLGVAFAIGGGAVPIIVKIADNC